MWWSRIRFPPVNQPFVELVKVNVLLADKGTPTGNNSLNLLNAGWTRTVLRQLMMPNPAGGPPIQVLITPPQAVAVFYELDHNYLNRQITITLALEDQDGERIQVPYVGPAPMPIIFQQQVFVPSPPQAPIAAPNSGNFLVELVPGLVIPANIYRWSVEIEGVIDPQWNARFEVLPPPSAPNLALVQPAVQPPQ